MAVTPYLKSFNTEGGTLYVFPSVSRDLTRTFVSSDYEFSFSHFACLNIPNIYPGRYTSGLFSNKPENAHIDDFYFATDKNKTYRYTSDGWNVVDDGKINCLCLSTLSPSYYEEGDDYCKAITENLQNYVMNFETAILNGEGDNDEYDNDILTTVSEKVFFNWLKKVGAIDFADNDTEEKYNTYGDRTVQYIGNIDVMNTVDINGDSFEELYIHIPSTVGASTNVYFRKGELTDNKNYLNKTYSIGGDGEKLIGRDGSVNPFDNEISTTPFVDIDTGGNFYTGDVGHTIDFRDSSYGDGISTMNGKSLEDFEFNAVLIYYDLYQKTSKSNVKKVATNLYGILFLDNVIEEGNTSRFQRYAKKRETVYGSGNSYVLKIDLKVDTIGDSNCDYEVVRDPNDDGTSMILYTKAIKQLQKCIDFFYTQKNEIVKLTERVSTLENLLLGIDTVDSLKKDIKRLYDMYDGNMAVDTAALLGLIDANAKKLDTIMNGGKDLKLQYDTDVLQPGHGIGMTKTMNKVVISSEDKYAINTVIDGRNEDEEIEINGNNKINTSDSLKICNIKLKPGENFTVLYINDDGNSDSNLNINIDESDYNWEIGQSLKIYFDCGDGSLVFEDDRTQGVVIKPTTNTTISIPGWKVEGNDLIEIVCVDDNKFIYLIK